MRIKDIAEKAGVSMITVSRVINTPEKVAPKTRERITTLLNEYGYTHNTAAHNLASKKSGIICLHASSKMTINDPFFQHFLIGVGTCLSKENYSIQIVNEIKTTQFCDGYILSGFNFADSALEEAKKTGKPIALFSSYMDPDVDSIDTDNVSSAKLIVNHLIEKGHRKIAVFLNDVKSTYVQERLNGYKRALSEHNIRFDEKYVHTVDNSISGGIEGAEWFKESCCDATAAFFITDIIAVGFIVGIKELGFNVPDDISVVGFDGLGHHLMSSPKITTVVQPVYEIAQALSKCLLDRIQNPNKPFVHKMIDGYLDEEESVRNIITKGG